MFFTITVKIKKGSNNNSSTPELRDISIKRIADMLKKNSFPPTSVNKLIQETKNSHNKQDAQKKRSLKLLSFHCLISTNKRVEKYTIP